MIGIAKILRRKYGSGYPFPRTVVPKPVAWAFGPFFGPVTRKFIARNVGHPVRFDNSRILSLGVTYRPIEETFADHFQQAIEDGFVRNRRSA